MARAKDKKDPFRLMGFGHRVYKTYDPRATIMRDVCYQLIEQLDIEEDPLLEIALALAKAATTDECELPVGACPPPLGMFCSHSRAYFSFFTFRLV